jgi:hypothetical protein
MWEIWCRQRRAANQENLDEADFTWKRSSHLSQGRSRRRQDGARPMNPQRYKYNPLGAQGGVTIQFQLFYGRHSPENRRRKMRERVK